MNIIYLDRDYLIEINKKIITTWNKRHPEQPEFLDVGIDRLDKILNIVRNTGNATQNENGALIIKASHLIGGLAWVRAFSGANKRTAVLSGTLFLRKNRLGLNLPREKYGPLRKLLFEIQED